ncbi:MAG TPA: nucleotide disphospho-sugar-binding domain-containing protein [Streptosporangiaceae bacterium]|jgi:UDP:flavonoid glycosyltransferase YjiC (YdhE family)
MRILFVPMAWYSHYFCMTPLAWACRAAGHEVRVAGQPGLMPVIEQSAMIGVPVGHDYDFVTDSSQLPVKISSLLQDKFKVQLGQPLPEQARLEAYELRFEPYARMTEAMAGDLVSFARSWRPDLVVGDAFVYAASIAAQAAGAPLVRHLMGPDWLRSIGFFPGFGMPGGPPEPWPAGLRAIFERHGAATAPDLAAGTVDPTPASLQIPDMAGRIPMRYVPYSGPGVAPSWVSEPAARTRVCVSWGKGATHLGGESGFPISAVAQALARLDAEVVIAVLSREDSGIPASLPANVTVAEGYPLHVLMPGCDVIVNQGGAGTMLTAAGYGLPQVIVPQVLDQAFCGQQLAATGSGILLPGQADGDAVRAAVSAVLESADIRRAAGKLQQEILGQPSPADVARDLEKLC